VLKNNYNFLFCQSFVHKKIFHFAVKPGVLRFGPQNDGTAAALTAQSVPTQSGGLLPAAGDQACVNSSRCITRAR